MNTATIIKVWVEYLFSPILLLVGNGETMDRSDNKKPAFFTHSFSMLLPDIIIDAVEQTFQTTFDGLLTPYPSYINRVFGITAEDGNRYVVKFYRPGRWSREAVNEEHEFLSDCAQYDIPVVLPIPDEENETVHELLVNAGSQETGFLFSLFPLKAGRNFEANTDEDWIRLGSLIGRVHTAGKMKQSSSRLKCLPEYTTLPFYDELKTQELVTPDERDEFYSLADRGLELVTSLFSGVFCQRIHGDCHGGNILDRADEGLLLFDFDDMMEGPPVQDLWLLLPDHAQKAKRELGLLLEGYEQFCEFDNTTIKLIEPLRFMRMIYFLVWCARQKQDHDFNRHFPGWGTKAFWLKEIEDFRNQLFMIEDALSE